jgi:hypothetical protein
MTDKPKTQRQKFNEMVSALEADTGEKRWEERLKKVARVAKDEPQGEPRKVVHKFKKAKEGH